MAKHLVVAVDWYGPYRSVSEARNVARSDNFAGGLYFAIGKAAEEDPLAPQYIGISQNLKNRVGPRHHKLNDILEPQIWLGEVGTARPSGRQLKKTPATLDYAEWLTAFFMELPLNEEKTSSMPDVAVTLLNRWWKKDYDTPHGRRPHPDWPDLIDYLGHAYSTKVVWFGKKMKRVKATNG